MSAKQGPETADQGQGRTVPAFLGGHLGPTRRDGESRPCRSQIADGWRRVDRSLGMRTCPETTKNASHGRELLASLMVFGSALRVPCRCCAVWTNHDVEFPQRPGFKCCIDRLRGKLLVKEVPAEGETFLSASIHLPHTEGTATRRILERPGGRVNPRQQE